MSRLIVATNNAGKTKEIKAILGGFYDEILSLKEAGIRLDVVEDGDTFEQNAVKKAVEASALTGCDTLADDSGLCVDALGGAPGVYSARYAGEDATDAMNNDKLIKEMAGVAERGAKFVCVMALVRNGEAVTAYGEVCGQIAQVPDGSGGFGYDPLFFYPPLGQTFGQLDADTKNSLSHRANALAALKKKLAEDA